jgi:CRISPR-associated protein Cmr2
MGDPKQNFIHAVAYCLASEKYGKADKSQIEEFYPEAEWALTPPDEETGQIQAPENPKAKIALVTGGATKIKSYVFESARLAEIRGASGLLDRINLEDLRRLWKEGIGCEECLIYANGGEALGFAPVGKAEWLADEIERIYTQETLVAQSVAVYEILTLRQLKSGLFEDQAPKNTILKDLLGYDPQTKPAFGQLVTKLNLAKYRRREVNPDESGSRELRGIAHFETFPFARRCSSCERRAAVVNARVSGDQDEDLPLCEPCARKRIFGMWTKREDNSARWWFEAKFIWEPDRGSDIIESWATRFKQWLIENPDYWKKYAVGEKGPLPENHQIRVARDLNELGEVSQPQGFIGVIYADGNNMGQLLEQLRTPNEYATFAEDVFDANKNAVFGALAENLTTREFERKPGDKFQMHPFEILSIGGDDLLLIVPADKALKIACDIAESVEQNLRGKKQFELKQEYSPEAVHRCQSGMSKDGTAPQSKVSFSAGVVLADAHTPFFYLESLASQLLKSAKSRAKWLKREYDYYGGTIDFLALKSVTTISGTVDEFRKATLARNGKRIYARPYTIAEMKTLLETISQLKHTGFPRTQLHRLRQSLQASLESGREQSTLDYLYFLSREKGVLEARREIELLWPVHGGLSLPPWRKRIDADEYETVWYDVMELYDFIEEEKTDAGNQD